MRGALLYRNGLAAVAIAVVALLGGVWPPLVLAQESGEPAQIQLPDPLTPEAIDALVSRLSDEQVRTLLIERLDAVAAEQATEPAGPVSAVDFLTDVVARTSSTVQERILATPDAIAAEVEVVTDIAARLGNNGIWQFLAIFAVAIASGIAAEWIVYRFMRRSRLPEPSGPEPRDVFEALPILGRRLVRDFAGVIVFFIVGHLVIKALMPPQDAALTHIVWRYLIVMPRIGNAILRFFLAPRRPDLRLVNCDDTTAWRLFRNFFGIVAAARRRLHAVRV